VRRNKVMHATHGNAAEVHFSMSAVNVNGLKTRGRWEQICSLRSDVLAICETHADRSLQNSLRHSAEDWHLIWGSPIDPAERAGVAIMVRKRSTWAVEGMNLDGTACEPYVREGRLRAARIHAVDGKRTFLLYSIYGVAGARWSMEKRVHTERMIMSAVEDSAARGLPAYIAGDFNLEVGDSRYLQGLMNHGGWHDAAAWGEKPYQDTSHKGHGSRIDLIIANKSAASLLCGYAVRPGIAPRDHSAVQVLMTTPVAAQTRYVVKKVGANESFLDPPEGYAPTTLASPVGIRAALARDDVDQAFSTWCSWAEGLLKTIPLTGGGRAQGSGRGKVAWCRQSAYPRGKEPHAQTVRTRRVAAAYGRAQEVAHMRDFGYRAERTWKAIGDVTGLLAGGAAAALEATLAKGPGTEAAVEASNILSDALVEERARDRKGRVKAWKERLQASEKKAYEWIHKSGSTQQTAMRRPGGGYTANEEEMLRLALKAWEPIFGKLAGRPARAAQFLESFGPTMRRSEARLEDITAEQLTAEAASLKESACGLDQWRPMALRALALWHPGVYGGLASILNHIETKGVWPSALVKGYTALVPKDPSLEDPGPADFRPITVMSAVYRLWARLRFRTALVWQETWIDGGAFGCRPRRGAEDLILDAAMDMEAPAFDEEGFRVGGIAYDFRKAFDLMPVELMLETLRARGASPRLLKPLGALYESMQRVFRLGGACGDWWRSYNGIIQGCPLSMIGLNAVVTVVLEVARSALQGVRPRTYADDLSATVRAESAEGLREGVRAFHAIVRAYEAADAGEISIAKSFTFGDPALQGCVGDMYAHVSQFCLVGGSIVTGEKKGDHGAAGPGGAAAMEERRFERWRGAVGKIRRAPVPWERKADMLLATQRMATFGQGTHTLAADVRELRKIRSAVMRSLWNADCYSMSPSVTFALLAPPQLDPEFAFVYEGLRTVARAMRRQEFADQLRDRFPRQTVKRGDGPLRRLQLLAQAPALAEQVNQLVAGGPCNEHRWAHDLRDAWRAHLWRRLATERPQHYGDVGAVDRRRTMTLYRELRDAARDEDADARARLGVLRRLLAGGLLTDDRVARHRGATMGARCECGAERATVEHVSWECPVYQDRRQEAGLPATFPASLPLCTRYAAIIPARLDLSVGTVRALQLMLVDVWRLHIQKWETNMAVYKSIADGSSAGAGADRAEADNGHVLEARRAARGVWCRKCGLYVEDLNHVRLKITSKPCTQAGLPQDRWLTSEGFFNSTARLADVGRYVDDNYNTAGHRMLWNRRLGKDIGSQNEGWLHCVVCRRWWRWKDRTQNLPRSICAPAEGALPRPVPANAGSMYQLVGGGAPAAPPVRRLVGKTSAADVARRTAGARPCSLPPATGRRGDEAGVGGMDGGAASSSSGPPGPDAALQFRRGIG
jgi:exonuclease III